MIAQDTSTQAVPFGAVEGSVVKRAGHAGYWRVLQVAERAEKTLQARTWLIRSTI